MVTTDLRHTGIDVVGDMPWGTHFCLFYENEADLLETLACYCKAGLESEEFCLWVVAAPVTVEDARRADALTSRLTPAPHWRRAFAHVPARLVPKARAALNAAR